MPLPRLLNLMEVRMRRAAKDEAEYQRNRAALYAPPKEARAASPGRRPGGMNRQAAMSMMAELATENATLKSG